LSRYDTPDPDDPNRRTGHPTNANAPPSTGGRLPSADLPGPGPLPAQGREPGVDAAADDRTVIIDPGGNLIDRQGRLLPPAEIDRLLRRLQDKYGPGRPGDSGGLPGGAAAGVGGAKSAPGILARALASVRKSVTTMAEITGRKDSDTQYVQGRGDGHSDELDEGEQPAPFNGGPVKSLPAAVQKTVVALRSVRKAVLPLAAVAMAPARAVNPANPHAVGADVSHLVRKGATGTEAEADVAAAQALGGRAGAQLGSGYNALGDRTPQVRRDGGLAAALQEIDVGRLRLQHTGGGKVETGPAGDGLTRQGNGAGGKIGTGQARVADGAHSGPGGGHGPATGAAGAASDGVRCGQDRQRPQR
jgi:hypothetical protein